MNFKYYDVLSTLISGVVLLFVLSIVIDWGINDINVTILLSLAYVMGYMLNVLSASTFGSYRFSQELKEL